MAKGKNATEETAEELVEETAEELGEEEVPVKAGREYRPGEKINGFIVTAVGLPNTCSVTGKPITEGYWFAANNDEARSGQGISRAAFENQGK